MKDRSFVGRYFFKGGVILLAVTMVLSACGPALSANINGGAASYMEDRRSTEGSLWGLTSPEGQRSWICTMNHGEQPLEAEKDDPWYGNAIVNLTDVEGWVRGVTSIITEAYKIFTVPAEQALNSDRAETMTCMATDSANRPLVADVADADGIVVGSGGETEANAKVDGPVRFMVLPEGQKVPLKKR